VEKTHQGDGEFRLINLKQIHRLAFGPSFVAAALLSIVSIYDISLWSGDCASSYIAVYTLLITPDYFFSREGCFTLLHAKAAASLSQLSLTPHNLPQTTPT
jgi:hypothetical protein